MDCHDDVLNTKDHKAPWRKSHGIERREQEYQKENKRPYKSKKRPKEETGKEIWEHVEGEWAAKERKRSNGWQRR